MIIPVAIDVALWLMPRLSVEKLLARVVIAWNALVKAVYTPSQLAALGDAFGYFQDSMAQLGQQVNLAMAVTTGWLAPTSALASVQANRLLLISDGVLAPLGIGLHLPGAAPLGQAAGAIEINSVWGAVAVAVGLWLLAQVLATLFLSRAALSLNGAVVGQGKEGGLAAPAPIEVVRSPFLRLFGRLLVLNLVLVAILWLLRIPLAAVTALAMVSSQPFIAFVFAVVGGLTLWLTLSFLVSMFLASDVMLMDGWGLWSSIWRGFIMARASGMRTLGFVVLINLLMLGARAVWGIIGQTLVGTVVAILGNGFLVTGMVLASMIYYDGLRREWQAVAASRASG